MNLNIHRSGSRGVADYGWLKAKYSFNFGDYFDPRRERFGVLRVLNDDLIAGGGGFNTHPHNNMEIITIPLSGALGHRDNLGNTSVIKQNEVQYMAAGTGVSHSEYNLSETETLSLLQIWIFPKIRNTNPSYRQINLEGYRVRNRIQVIVSPEGGENIIGINQNAWLSLLDSDKGLAHTYKLNKPDNNIFMFVIEGAVETGMHQAFTRDSIEVTGAGEITFQTNEKTEILIIEVPED